MEVTMNKPKQSKSSFNWYKSRQRFSIRKYHFGAASVLLGAALVLGGGQVAADEPSASNDILRQLTRMLLQKRKKGQKSQSQHQLLK